MCHGVFVFRVKEEKKEKGIMVGLGARIARGFRR
jgi:hypothetical protein